MVNITVLGNGELFSEAIFRDHNSETIIFYGSALIIKEELLTGTMDHVNYSLPKKNRSD